MILFDAKILNHKVYTGVENYTQYILKYLKKDIKIIKPNITNKYLSHIHTHLITPFIKGELLFEPANIAPIFVPKNKKLVVTLHDIAFITHPDSFSKVFRKYYQYIIPKVIKRANKIITVSNFTKFEILKYYPFAKNKIEVIYLGVDKKFRVLDIEKQNYILYVGSINKRKNFISVLKAFMQLDIDYKLIMVGNFHENFSLNEESKYIIKKAKKSNKIEFRENISDEELIKLYNLSKLFIYPSFYEGFGLPIVEAMACGTPVITSNVSSLPEVGGDAVVYVDPNDIEDIKEKIIIVLNDEDLQKQMIQKGLKRAKEFTWEKSAKKHLEVFGV
jgi:glycosyltransferase involved in cell wall biosynthesis